MSSITVSQDKDHFTLNGKSFFLLADTLWTAFSNISMEEWEEYLNYRQMQGFNSIQINILTQWDAGKPDTGLYPYAIDADGKFDFNKMNDEYFIRAEKMLEISSGKGFTPILAVLWGNYVPDTWMSVNNGMNIMPLEAVRFYSEYIARSFSRFKPIYLISGDTTFGSEKTVQHYMTALQIIKNIDPDAPVSFHLGGGIHEIPEEIVKSGYLNFYTYQSSHNIESQNLAYTLAGKFLEKPVKRPVINSEPCYEGHAFGGKYGRYNEFHVRRAIWQSLLSGAKAGVAYGAHGLWGWYKEGKQFSNEGYGGKPLPWRTALRLKGAWDAAFARWIFETFGLFDLEPVAAVLNETEEIRMSISKNTRMVVLYAPYNADIRIGTDFDGYDWTLISLSCKSFLKPDVKKENGAIVIKMHPFNDDVLIIGKCL